MQKMKLVMVGNGMAGVRTLEELLKIAPDLYEIAAFGAEPHPNYNRILLSPVLAGEQTLDEIVLNSWDWYREHGIRLHAGRKVVAIDRVRRIVRADDGTEEAYDRLLLATGSNPFLLPVPGQRIDESAFLAWCRVQMANYKVPRRVQVLDNMPLNATGKVAKQVLRAWVAEPV